jgi:hypothetical protein
MARCVSFVQSLEHTAAWERCVRQARAGDIFCTVHRGAIDGVVMGIHHHSEPYHVSKKQTEKAALEARTRSIAFETALASLTIPSGHGIGRVRKESGGTGRVRGKQKSEAGCESDSSSDGGKDAATAAAPAEARADWRGTA